MIQNISLDNFKTFKNLDNLSFKPITIFCGSNSCGKSTILQNILLLKQSLESKNSDQTILLNGKLVHLGSFENIIYQRELENEITFHFKFKYKDFQSRTFRSFVMDWANIDNSNVEYVLIDYKVTLKSNKSSVPSSAFLKPVKILQVKFSTDFKLKNGEIKKGPDFYIKHLKDELYSILWNNLHSDDIFMEEDTNFESGELQTKIRFANLCPVSFELDHENNKYKIEVFVVLRPIMSISDILRTLFETVTYIGPLREEPSRRYIYEDEIVEIGIKGENAAYIYLSEQDKNIYDHYFIKEDKFVKSKPTKLADAMDNWLSYMGIKGLKPENNNEIIHINLQSSDSSKTRVSIADVGFGVSQVFPIILEGLRMKKGNTLLLEQPEIHLHPKLQMQMADYLISLAMSKKNIVVETHSDHMINRLVRRIVEDESGKLNDLISIYFITPSEEGSQYESVVIDSNKGIVNWPEGFFDQNASEQEKIIRAGIKKRASQRNKEQKK